MRMSGWVGSRSVGSSMAMMRLRAEQLDLFTEDKPGGSLVGAGESGSDTGGAGASIWQSVCGSCGGGWGHRFFEEHLPPGRESVGWAQVASILALGRFCEQASEALEDLMAVDVDEVYDNRLYRGLDRVLPLRRNCSVILKDAMKAGLGRVSSFFYTT